MEMEFELLDAKTLDLTQGILPVMELYPNSEMVKPEFIQNTVEIASKPCVGVPQLWDEMRGVVADLIREVGSLSMALSGGATHPFSQSLAVITPLPRYQAMQARYGHTARTQITFATHVHVGVDSGVEAVQLMNELKTVLPLLIAVSANSPMWRGYETGFASYRRVILASSRSYGQPPKFASWAEFSDFFEQSRQAGVYATVNDIHWDLRPRPQLGTVEVRAMDAQTTLSEACALAALIRGFVAYFRSTRDTSASRPLQPVAWWVHKDNCYLAARDGIDAQIIIDSQGVCVPLLDVIQTWLDNLIDVAPQNEKPMIARILKRVSQRSLGYQRQREVYRENGSSVDVVAYQCQQLQNDLDALAALH